MSALPYIDGDTLRRLVPMEHAVRALSEALLGGLDPEECPRRPVVDLPAGQLLLMPASYGRHAGIKVASVAPANPGRGLPRIQGTYLLFDGPSLTPLASMDGIALTSLRTPAVSALAARHLARPDARTLTVFGTGPQAWGHVEALRAVRPIEHVTVVARNLDGARDLAAHCSTLGLTATVGTAEGVAGADVIVCCTSAREPLFPGALVADGALVVAVGSHEPDARELDGDLMARATVVVESRTSALAEAGDVIMAIRSGLIGEGHLAGGLAELVNGAVEPGSGPRVFKSVGMAWEDLVVAAAAHDAWAGR
ncbi:ornithine cyclodeaminase family protein [Sphaerisporangium sp. NPDC049002]|uniref:ornithine cyclodeaminase family protein n=1 Tax=unclassified Sphaerisporangium TaxID=2630420 RepID=UPI0034035BD1